MKCIGICGVCGVCGIRGIGGMVRVSTRSVGVRAVGIEILVRRMGLMRGRPI